MIHSIENLVVGSNDAFELEHRCYNGVCLAAALGCLFASVFNPLVGIPVQATVFTVTIGTIYLFLYLKGRRSKTYQPVLWLYILSGVALLALTWILNGGINGSDILVSMVALVAMTVVVKTRRLLLVFTILIPTMSALFLLEYLYPELIIAYSSREQRFLDVYITMVISTVVISSIITLILNSYDHEKKRLEESKKQYQLIVENISNVVWTMDMDFHNTYISPSVYKQKGYTPEEIRNQPLCERLPPDSIETVMNLYNEKLKLIEDSDSAGWEPIEFEIEQLCKDGSTIWTTNTVRILPGQDKRPESILGTTQDITKRKMAEAALQENEEKYKRIFNNLQDVYYESGMDGTILEVSPSIEKISQYKREELIGKSLYDIYTIPEERNEFVKIILDEGKVNDYEVHLKNKDGSRRICSITTSLMRDKRGTPKLIGSMRDISKNKRAEEELREVEDRFRLAFHTSPDSINLNRLDDGTYIDINDGFTGIMGYTREDVIGKSSLSLNIWKKPEDRKRLVDGLMKTGYVKNMEAEFVGKNGKIVWGLMSARIVKISNKNVIISITRDITDRKRMEVALRESEMRLQQAQKMESIGTLAGGIAHDFNNILFPIVGYAEMLLEDIPEDAPYRNSIKEIYSGAMRARELVKQILTFSRQDSSKIKLMKIQPVITEALELIRATIPTSIEIKQYISNDCGIIKADPTQIHQIVLNLATNAYHAMEEAGGVLSVSLEQTILDEQDLIAPNMKPGVYAGLTIADTGVGIDADVSKNIFDPFFTTKELGKGTGMGLSVVHGIVHNAGGGIQVDSEPGKGSKFRIYLPVVKNAYGQQAIPEKESIPRGGEQILLVDDEEAIVSMEKQILERLGYQVVSRTSSIEALEAFRANPGKFDIVITDMNMPNMSGDKLASELIKIRNDIPILLCTGFSEKVSEEKATAMGIKNFLMKPIAMNDLSKMIRKVLDDTESSVEK